MQFLVATSNRGKLEEIRSILVDSGKDVVGLDDIGVSDIPEETGTTFGENALIKARYYHALTGLVTLADDSGLEVEELAGAPGIKSARYAGFGATDQARIDKLLAELKDTPEGRRAARFVCAAGVVWKDGQRLFIGEVSGTILARPSGSNGFGYDPIFYYPQCGKTFAELSRDQKSRISHRGRALRRVAEWLKESFLEGNPSC